MTNDPDILAKAEGVLERAVKAFEQTAASPEPVVLMAFVFDEADAGNWDDETTEAVVAAALAMARKKRRPV